MNATAKVLKKIPKTKKGPIIPHRNAKTKKDPLMSMINLQSQILNSKSLPKNDLAILRSHFKTFKPFIEMRLKKDPDLKKSISIELHDILKTNDSKVQKIIENPHALNEHNCESLLHELLSDGSLSKVKINDIKSKYPLNSGSLRLIEKLTDKSTSLQFQRRLKKLTLLGEIQDVDPCDIIYALTSLSPQKQLIFLYYLPLLVHHIPFHSDLFKLFFEMLVKSRDIAELCKVLHMDLSLLQYNEKMLLKFDYQYLIAISYILLNSKYNHLEPILKILKHSLAYSESAFDEHSIGVCESIHKSLKAKMKDIKFYGDDTDVDLMIKYSRKMGVINKKNDLIPNYTISTLIKFTRVMSLSKEFNKVRLASLIKFWYVMLHSKGHECLQDIGFWDIIAEHEKKNLLKKYKGKIDFDYSPDEEYVTSTGTKLKFNDIDLPLFLNILFYITKSRDLDLKEFNYIITMLSKNVESPGPIGQKLFGMYIGYSLTEKNSAILLKFHRIVLDRYPEFKLFKKNIFKIVMATSETKISDLDLVLSNLVDNYKDSRYELDEEIIKVLNELIEKNSIDIAQELYNKYNILCHPVLFQYDFSKAMNWDKNRYKKVGYKRGIVNTKVNGVKVKVFDQMLDDI